MENTVEQKTNSKGVFIFLFSFIAALSLAGFVWLKSVHEDRIANENKLTDFGALPKFNFEERNGSTIGPDQLKGKVWVVNFIFTAATHGW